MYIIIKFFFFRFLFSHMAPKKDTKEASASAKKKDTPTATPAAAPATASAKKPATTGTKVVTKERKEKVQSKALKAKQRVVR